MQSSHFPRGCTDCTPVRFPPFRLLGDPPTATRRWMSVNRLPQLSSGVSRNSSLSPRPPRTRSSGARQLEPGGAAHQRQAQGRTQIHTVEPAGSVMPALEAKSVAELLRNHGTRDATLFAMEEHATPINGAVSLAAAPALVELTALDTSEVGKEQWDRVCLLIARLIAEAEDDPIPVYSAAFGEGRLAARYRSEGNTVARALLRPAEELTLEDARSIAYSYAHEAPTHLRGSTKPMNALEFNAFEWLRLWLSEDPLTSKCGPCFATCLPSTR